MDFDHLGTDMLMKELDSPFKTPEGLKRPEAAILIFFLGFVLTTNERKKTANRDRNTTAHGVLLLLFPSPLGEIVPR